MHEFVGGGRQRCSEASVEDASFGMFFGKNFAKRSGCEEAWMRVFGTCIYEFPHGLSRRPSGLVCPHLHPNSSVANDEERRGFQPNRRHFRLARERCKGVGRRCDLRRPPPPRPPPACHTPAALLAYQPAGRYGAAAAER